MLAQIPLQNCLRGIGVESSNNQNSFVPGPLNPGTSFANKTNGVELAHKRFEAYWDAYFVEEKVLAKMHLAHMA